MFVNESSKADATSDLRSRDTPWKQKEDKELFASVPPLSLFRRLTVRTMMKKTLVFASMAVVTHAFQFPSLPDIFKPPSAAGATKPNPLLVAQKKKELLEAVSFTENGKTASPETQARVLQIVGEIEKAAPPSPNLLSDPDAAQQLGGVWYLQYTSPSVVGDEDQFPVCASRDGFILSAHNLFSQHLHYTV
jgi:hypothetical protein